RRHTRLVSDWSSDVCSSDLRLGGILSSEIGYDLTSYSLIAPSESYQAVVELLADLIQNPAYKPEDVKGAAQLALLESRREQDERSEERRVGEECRSRWSTDE